MSNKRWRPASRISVSRQFREAAVLPVFDDCAQSNTKVLRRSYRVQNLTRRTTHGGFRRSGESTDGRLVGIITREKCPADQPGRQARKIHINIVQYTFDGRTDLTIINRVVWYVAYLILTLDKLYIYIYETFILFI